MGGDRHRRDRCRDHAQASARRVRRRGPQCRSSGDARRASHRSPASPAPQRTDPDRPTRSPRIRAILWAALGSGERRPCPGCDRAKWHDDFHLDHVTPRSKGGLDSDENLQLLCAACNSRKGNRLTMSELRASWGLPAGTTTVTDYGELGASNEQAEA
ncbi:HNH endonuclease signature motif containing protein [Candidatus Poriferisodalis multihospitum]|uniref:HNH endonuclease signature motif containing protein n=1 Tax=Candidatus Poriferisodalis multihospitum TaxID=2983191 RepID=UPI003A4D81B8